MHLGAALFYGTKFVDTLLKAIGLGVIGLLGIEDPILIRDLRRRGCRVKKLEFETFLHPKHHAEKAPFDCLLIPASFANDARLLGQMAPLIDRWRRRFLAVAFTADDEPSALSIAATVLSAGYRLTPAGLRHVKDGVMVFERCAMEAGDHGLERDFTRSLTPMAAEVAELYSTVASFVRPDDLVFDVSDTLGSGPAYLAAHTRAAKIVCRFESLQDQAYAQKHFGADHRIDLRTAAGGFDGVSPQSIGLVVGLDNPDRDPAQWLKQLRALVRPDGRLIFSLAASNFTYAAGELKIEGLPPDFMMDLLIERRIEKKNWGLSIFVASINPLTARATSAYSHPQFDPSLVEGAHFIDMGRYYKNPWLYRSMVQMGERVTDRETLTEMALSVIKKNDMTSADFGAALAVVGYDIRSQGRISEAGSWRILADAYLSQESRNPHILRWRISLAYLRAMISLDQGYTSRALRDFTDCGAMDAMGFSPLLATKTVGASSLAGLLYVSRGKINSAKSCFARGIQIAQAALRSSDVNMIGNPEFPAEFGFQELAELFDMTAQCSIALRALDLLPFNPGFLWTRINVKRFGLNTWSLDLEKENAELRNFLNRRNNGRPAL